MTEDHDVSNEAIAQVLEQIADLLESGDENPFRIRAYRQGAASVRASERPVADLVGRASRDDLLSLPDVGEGLAAVIDEFVQTGRSAQLESLQGEHSPESVIATVPGIGPELSGRVVRDLNISTLAELEQAAHDGRLEAVEGFGPRRVKAVLTSLAGTLGRSAGRRQQERVRDRAEPPIATLLEVDEAYRRQAAAGSLRRIAPRRFNPEAEAWLPVMHTRQDEWEITALFSNTALAHEAGKTDDWVVLYYERDGHEDQVTVVTETTGPLKGKRVVRGREAESARHYQSSNEESGS